MADNQPQGRNSEGVVAIRHPRTDVPEFGWIVTPAASMAYNAFTGYAWYSETQAPRAAAIARMVRDTNVSLGWLFQSIPGTVNPALYDWGIQSLRNVRDRSLYLDGEKRPSHGLGGGSDPIAPFDPAVSEWPIDSQRQPNKPYWTSRWIGIDWLTPDITTPFNPSSQPWSQDSQRPTKSTQNRLISWTRSGYFLSLFDDFEFAKFPWHTDSQRVPHDPYWTNLWIGTDFIPPELRAVFTPASQLNWQIDSQRVPAPPYWNSAWQGNDWLTPALLAQIAFNPATEDWTAKTNTYQSRAWWSDSPHEQAWMVPAVKFDPKLWPSIPISSHRHWPKAVGRWQPDVDNAWLTENPVVPNTFNPSFAMDTNDLVEPGSLLIHPGDSPGHA